MMHEGTLRIPGQILFLSGDTAPKNHNAMTKYVAWSKSFGIRAKSPSGKNAATKPAGDPIAIGTWRQNSFPPSWNLGLGNVTYLVIPGCSLQPCTPPACLGRRRRCLFLPQRVSHSSSPGAVTASWCALASYKQEQTQYFPVTPHTERDFTSRVLFLRHRTKPTHYRDITKAWPRHHWHITALTNPGQDRDITKHDRDISVTLMRHHWNITETSPRHQKSNAKTRPRHHRDNAKTSRRQGRDILGDIFPGACAAPDRLIHVRPQAYRYWGTKCSRD